MLTLRPLKPRRSCTHYKLFVKILQLSEKLSLIQVQNNKTLQKLFKKIIFLNFLFLISGQSDVMRMVVFAGETPHNIIQNAKNNHDPINIKRVKMTASKQDVGANEILVSSAKYFELLICVNIYIFQNYSAFQHRNT